MPTVKSVNKLHCMYSFCVHFQKILPCYYNPYTVQQYCALQFKTECEEQENGDMKMIFPEQEEESPEVSPTLIGNGFCSWARIFRKLFSKRCTFGSLKTKSLVRRYQAKFTKTAPDHLKVCHTWYNVQYNRYSLMIRKNWIMWIKNISTFWIL